MKFLNKLLDLVGKYGRDPLLNPSRAAAGVEEQGPDLEGLRNAIVTPEAVQDHSDGRQVLEHSTAGHRTTRQRFQSLAVERKESDQPETGIARLASAGDAHEFSRLPW